MAREIVLDTETTGLDPRTGHRLVEIGCVELVDFLPTGRSFHRYVHPEREMDPEAERVHGLTTAFLADKPHVCDAFLEFVGDAVVVAHNAAFDRSFLNHELERAGRAGLPPERWVDTLPLAQKRFPGVHNSLDALCKRFKISLADREKHGALIDAQLLAAVYLELNGGRERGLDLTVASTTRTLVLAVGETRYGPRPRPLGPRSTDAEREAHLIFVRGALAEKAVWVQFGLDLSPAT
jgi:DNA polymerase III subunit epsilon